MTIRLIKHHALAPLVGFLLILPLMLLEWITTSDAPRSAFPSSLFIFMGLVATVFILVLQSLVGKINFTSLLFWVKLIILGTTLWSFSTLLIDQWPCFLGATGC